MRYWGDTAAVPAPDRASPARSQEIYQHYAVVLYRQALLHLDDPDGGLIFVPRDPHFSAPVQLRRLEGAPGGVADRVRHEQLQRHDAVRIVS